MLLFIGIHLVHELYNKPTFASDISSIQTVVHKKGIGLPLIVLLLMFIQWILEAFKWKILMSTSIRLPWITSLKMIFTGLSFSFITPFKSGEFIGRVMYLPEDKRAIGTAFTFYGNIIQFTIYSMLGTTALWLLDLDMALSKTPASLTHGILLLKSISPLIPLVCVIFFIFKSTLINFFVSFKIFTNIRPLVKQFLSITVGQTFLIFLLTISKCIIFSVQYWLIFQWLGLGLSFPQVFTGISIMLLGLAVMPTFAFLEIGIRWEFSFIIFSVYTQNLAAITIGITIVWFLNIVMPAIMGAFWLMLNGQSNKKNLHKHHK